MLKLIKFLENVKCFQEVNILKYSVTDGTNTIFNGTYSEFFADMKMKQYYFYNVISCIFDYKNDMYQVVIIERVSELCHI